MQVTQATRSRRRWRSCAKKSASGVQFDIGIIDIMMPDMSGYELARIIRRIYGPAMPLLAFSSSTNNKCAAVPEAGFNGYLLKPISRIKLFTMMEMLLGSAVCPTSCSGDQSRKDRYAAHHAGGGETYRHDTAGRGQPRQPEACRDDADQGRLHCGGGVKRAAGHGKYAADARQV